jgi:hypothetical protein
MFKIFHSASSAKCNFIYVHVYGKLLLGLYFLSTITGVTDDFASRTQELAGGRRRYLNEKIHKSAFHQILLRRLRTNRRTDLITRLEEN